MKKRPLTKRTLLPTSDPLDRDRDRGSEKATEPTPGQFDPAAYAHIVESGRLTAPDRLPTFRRDGRCDGGKPEPSLAKTVGPPASRPQRTTPTLGRSSVVRLRTAELVRSSLPVPPRASGVLSHIDGVCDAEEVAQRSGIPRDEALARLQMLVRLGIVEVVG